MAAPGALTNLSVSRLAAPETLIGVSNSWLAQPRRTSGLPSKVLAAAGAQELRIGVVKSRSQNIQRELRRAGRLLDTGRGSKNVVLRDRRFLIWRRQYRVEQTILASLETGIAVGGLGNRKPCLSCRNDQHGHEYGRAR